MIKPGLSQDFYRGAWVSTGLNMGGCDHLQTYPRPSQGRGYRETLPEGAVRRGQGECGHKGLGGSSVQGSFERWGFWHLSQVEGCLQMRRGRPGAGS